MPEKVATSLLEFVGTTIISETTEQFVARDKFVNDTSDKAELKISYLGNNFKKWFLDKKEAPMAESELRIQELKKSEVDGPIIAELGGEEKAKITLAELYGFLKQAEMSKWFVCYVPDKDGLLRAVCVYWYGVGWPVSPTRSCIRAGGLRAARFFPTILESLKFLNLRIFDPLVLWHFCPLGISKRAIKFTKVFTFAKLTMKQCITEWLRLFRQGFRKFFAGVALGTPCARV